MMASARRMQYEAVSRHHADLKQLNALPKMAIWVTRACIKIRCQCLGLTIYIALSHSYGWTLVLLQTAVVTVMRPGITSLICYLRFLCSDFPLFPFSCTRSEGLQILNWERKRRSCTLPCTDIRHGPKPDWNSSKLLTFRKMAARVLLTDFYLDSRCLTLIGMVRSKNKFVLWITCLAARCSFSLTEATTVPAMTNLVSLSVMSWQTCWWNVHALVLKFGAMFT